nr:MAG TPA: hypothetical protein [Caudoviricetes sp.]
MYSSTSFSKPLFAKFVCNISTSVFFSEFFSKKSIIIKTRISHEILQLLQFSVQKIIVNDRLFFVELGDLL